MSRNDRSKRAEPFFSEAVGPRRKDTTSPNTAELSKARAAERQPAESTQDREQRIMELELRIVQLQDQLQRILAEVESLRRARAETDAVVARIKDQLQRSQAEAEGARRVLEEAERAVLQLKNQLQRAQAEAKDTRRAREEAERAVLQLKNQLQRAQADAESARRAREDSARLAGQAEGRIVGLEAETKELQEQLGEAQDAAEAANRRADAVLGEAASKDAEALKQANEEIVALEAELAQLKDQLLRALADAENTRRRLRKEVEDTAKYAIANLAKDLLSAPDNLRRALDNIPAEGRKSDELLDRLAAGVELVERELHAILERYGIKKIDPLGQPFDHNFHQALFDVPTADHPPGTVVQVLAPGYVIHNRLLRPAMVGVAKAPPEETNGKSDQPADTAA